MAWKRPRAEGPASAHKRADATPYEPKLTPSLKIDTRLKQKVEAYKKTFQACPRYNGSDNVVKIYFVCYPKMRT
jgi:hypothetical protein